MIELETVAALCELRDHIPVPVRMRYDLADPLVVRFTFQYGDEVEWRIGRDLLAEGADSTDPVGWMDVHVWRGLSPGLLWLMLSPGGGGSCLLAFSRRDVTKFLRRCYALVARGEEFQQLDMDEAISKLLENRA